MTTTDEDNNNNRIGNGTGKVSTKSIGWNNPLIKKNEEQAQAVVNVINYTHQGIPFLLFGPFGTGISISYNFRLPILILISLVAL